MADDTAAIQAAMDFFVSQSNAIISTLDGVAQRFRNSIHDLTIHTGDGNPGAIGIRYVANNQGSARNLLLIAGDGDGDGTAGDGVLGIDLRNNEVGSCLIKNVEIRGFDRGIMTESTQNSVTLENITLIVQQVTGIDNRRNAIFVRGLIADNQFGRPAITNFRDGGSFITLFDATIRNTSGTTSGNAISYFDFSNGFPNQTNVFLRNVTVENYSTAINVLTGFKDLFPANGLGVAYIDEFISDTSNNSQVERLWPNIERSLNLPIMDTPVVPWGASSGWVNVLDFLTPSELFIARDIELTTAVQSALNSGAHTIYFPRAGNVGSFSMESDVTVPATVRRIIGLETNLRGAGRFIIPAGVGTETLAFDRIYPMAGGIHHESARTVVVRNSNLKYTSATSGAGDFYGEDILGSMIFNQQDVWIRQFNSECVSPRLQNYGGNLWVMGIKTECEGPVVETYDGGNTEVLGTFFYTSDTVSNNDGQPHNDPALPAFITIDSNLSVAGHREQNFVDNGYAILAEETRLDETRQFLDNGGGGVVASAFMLYVGYTVDAANNEAPIVEAGATQDILFTQTQSVQLEGVINDDGYPNQGTTLTSLWAQTSGPGTVTFADTSDPQTTATFSEAGTYVLTLTAFEGDPMLDLSTSDTVTIHVFSVEVDTSFGQGADSGLNGGVSGGMTIRHNSFPRMAYMRFDLSSINFEDFVEAGFYAEMNGSAVQIGDWVFNVFGLFERSDDDYGAGKLGELWDETLISYSNAPGNNTSQGGGAYDANVTNSAGVLGNFTVHLGQFFSRQRINETQSINTTALSDFLASDTDGVVTFMITREEFVSNSGRTISLATKEQTALPAPTLKFVIDTDFDDDGLPNNWEIANGLDPLDDGSINIDNGAEGDLEPDGFTNFYEWGLGGDPNVRDAALIRPIFSFDTTSTPNLELTYREGSSLLNYRVDYSADLNQWFDASTVMDYSNDFVETQNGVDVYKATVPFDSQTRRFIRLQINY